MNEMKTRKATGKRIPGRRCRFVYPVSPDLLCRVWGETTGTGECYSAAFCRSNGGERSRGSAVGAQDASSARVRAGEELGGSGFPDCADAARVTVVLRWCRKYVLHEQLMPRSNSDRCIDGL